MDLHVRVYVELFVNEIVQSETVASLHADRTSFYLNTTDKRRNTVCIIFFFPWRHAYPYKCRCFFSLFFLFSLHILDSQKNCEPRSFLFASLPTTTETASPGVPYPNSVQVFPSRYMVSTNNKGHATPNNYAVSYPLP